MEEEARSRPRAEPRGQNTNLREGVSRGRSLKVRTPLGLCLGFGPFGIWPSFWSLAIWRLERLR
jgi:hypothetical protein